MRDSYRSSGKSLSPDGFLQNREGGLKPMVLFAQFLRKQSVRNLAQINLGLLLCLVYNTLNPEMKFPRAIPVAVSFLIVALYGSESLASSTAPKKAKAKPTAAKETVNMTAVDALIGDQVANDSITGAVLVVGHDGHVVHQKAFG